MAWSKVYYDTKRQDQLSTTSDDSGNITQQLIQTYIAVDDGASGQPTTLSAAIATAGGNTVPLVGAVYTINGQAGFKCTQSIPKRTTESPFVFEIQCTYTRKFVFQPDSVTKWQVSISVGGQKFTQQCYQDSTGADLVNTAGEAYDPSVTETHYDETISVSYMTASADSSTFAGLRGKVNSGACSFNISGMSRSFTARQLLCDDVQMSTTFTLSDNTTPVWKVTINLVARQDTFVDKILDQGYYQLQTISGTSKRVPILDPITHQPLSAPALLDASGAALAVGGTPHYSTFKIEGEADLSPLFAGLS